MNYTTMTLSLTGILIRALIKGTGLPFLITNTLMFSVLPTSSRHSTLVSKQYSREGTSRGSYGACVHVCVCKMFMISLFLKVKFAGE